MILTGILLFMKGKWCVEMSSFTWSNVLHVMKRPPDFRCCICSTAPQTSSIQFANIIGFIFDNGEVVRVLWAWTMRVESGS